jgi:hypothetical protein
MSALPQATTPNPHANLLNVQQITNKMEFQPKKTFPEMKRQGREADYSVSEINEVGGILCHSLETSS